MSTPVIAGDMQRRPDPARAHVDLAGTGFGIGNELGNRLRRDRRMHLHDERHADDAGNGGDVADEIEIELLVKRCVDRVGGAHDEQRIAVRRCADRGFDRNIASCAASVLDDALLPEPLREPLPHHARGDVGRAARGEADDQADRPRRIGLCTRSARSGERGGARGEMQKLATGKSHHAKQVARIERSEISAW
jgi:hypothetical protein